jgi:hypothetical protein
VLEEHTTGFVDAAAAIAVEEEVAGVEAEEEAVDLPDGMTSETTFPLEGRRICSGWMMHIRAVHLLRHWTMTDRMANGVLKRDGKGRGHVVAIGDSARWIRRVTSGYSKPNT